MLTELQIESFEGQGYVIIDNAIPDGMLQPLREATGRVAEKTRRGEWPYKRSTGEDDIWGVSHLLHPDLCEPIFAEYMASPVVIDVVGGLLRLSTEDRPKRLQLDLVNMLLNPAKRDYEIDWHRDTVRADFPPEEEIKELTKRQYGVQWNTALYDEACLYIVPGSHRRPKTEEEREIVLSRPKDFMPGQMAVRLKAGQGVYYNANLLHRGVYPRDMRRETLHCCMGLIEGAPLRVFVYKSLAWMEAPNFRKTLPERLTPLYDNYVRMSKKFKQG